MILLNIHALWILNISDISTLLTLCRVTSLIILLIKDQRELAPAANSKVFIHYAKLIFVTRLENWVHSELRLSQLCSSTLFKLSKSCMLLPWFYNSTQRPPFSYFFVVYPVHRLRILSAWWRNSQLSSVAIRLTNYVGVLAGNYFITRCSSQLSLRAINHPSFMLLKRSKQIPLAV